MYGVSTINLELSSRCNAACFCCGRRKLERLDPDWKNTLGDMDWGLAQKIISQFWPGLIVQAHFNGESTLHPRFGEAADLIRRQGAWACVNTNGLNLYEKRDQLANLDSLTVSIISDDEQDKYDRQIEQLNYYMGYHNYHGGPLVNMRMLGDRVPSVFFDIAKRYGITVVKRIFHSPDMSRDYEKPVTLPEIGVCLDLLTHPAIDRHGRVSTCVRFDHKGLNVIGDLKTQMLQEILAGDLRREFIEQHFKGNRNIKNCAACEFWGVPRS